VIDFLINVCESMGANITNSMLEAVTPMIEEISGAKAGYYIYKLIIILILSYLSLLLILLILLLLLLK
jgi:hypothetical protein